MAVCRDPGQLYQGGAQEGAAMVPAVRCGP